MCFFQRDLVTLRLITMQCIFFQSQFYAFSFVQFVQKQKFSINLPLQTAKLPISKLERTNSYSG